MANPQKRLLLKRVLNVMAWTMTAAVIYVLFFGSSENNAEGETVWVSIDDVNTQRVVEVKWQGLPVMVVARTDAAVAKLSRADDLRDPDSSASEQPPFAENAGRSLQPNIFVVIALGTAIDCPVNPVFENDALVGFADRCRGWRYDAAGRVFNEQDALKNLAVPPYRIGDGQVIIGETN